jgi:hypothetical protein
VRRRKQLNLLGKHKINQKQISEYNLYTLKNIISSLSATLKELNIETLPESDQNQQRQRNGMDNKVQLGIIARGGDIFEYINCSFLFNSQCIIVYDYRHSRKMISV